MSDSPAFVHETAVVDEGAQLGPNTKVWHFCHVSGNTKIGRDCSFGQNVFVAPNVTIGNNCKIQNNVSLYDGVVLEDDVFCGPSMVFTNVLNPRSHVSRKDEYLRTVVGQGTSIGANATIVCGHDIGKFAFIAAGAVVTKHVPDYALMVGVPARQVGWVCNCGEQLKIENERAHCIRCQRTYSLQPSGDLVQQ